MVKSKYLINLIKYYRGGNNMKKGPLLQVLLVIMLFATACGSQKDIMRAEDWKDKYPEIYASYRRNAEMNMVGLNQLII